MVAVIDAATAATAAIGGRLRLIDVVGRGDDGKSLLLLPEVDREQAREIVERALARRAEPRAAGLAMCPTDACDVDTILLAARAAARRADAGHGRGSRRGRDPRSSSARGACWSRIRRWRACSRCSSGSRRRSCRC